jgi:uncharacterized protein YaeQ
MALTATMRRFEIALADSDRGVYEQLDLRVAQHPSESERFLVARVLARALEHADGVEFGRGVSTDDEPALWQRDLRGDLLAWIEVGAPSPDRLHKASKRASRIVVYTWKDPERMAAEIVERGVHRAEAIELYALDPELLDAIAAGLDRNNRWDLSVAGGGLFLSTGAAQHEGSVRRVTIQIA